MENEQKAKNLRNPSQFGLVEPCDEPVDLTVTIDVEARAILFEWTRASEVVAMGRFVTKSSSFMWFASLEFHLTSKGTTFVDSCNSWPSSTRAIVQRIRKLFPKTNSPLRFGVKTDRDLGPAKSMQWQPVELKPSQDAWKLVQQQLRRMSQLSEECYEAAEKTDAIDQAILRRLVCELFDIPSPPIPLNPVKKAVTAGSLLGLQATFDKIKGEAAFIWTRSHTGKELAVGRIHCEGNGQLVWELDKGGGVTSVKSSDRREDIREMLNQWLQENPTNQNEFTAFWIQKGLVEDGIVQMEETGFGPDKSVYSWIENNIVILAETRGYKIARIPMKTAPIEIASIFPGVTLTRLEQKQMAERDRLRQEALQKAEERQRRELNKEKLRQTKEREKKELEKKERAHAVKSSVHAKESPPLPPVPMRFETPSLEMQETAFPLASLDRFFLHERAALWWVSGQSDKLLCLQYCRIDKLEYQLRTALRVLGPLRGRALLSDEVGLGKTIEAGIILKELLTRGMVKRFLVLTVPSLVDQWEEELSDKFGLSTVTTNHDGARDDAQRFWGANAGIVASLHTLKQPAQLEVARQVHWDILIVDEAHYLRNRESQAWQAVNALPRQFLLLLTATPVQNSLEELYNLVTLLQPGQLPAPKEFRARFIDPKHPRQPREPDELRRLLGQVMIRNTRANAGINLPPRRAETVMFEPDESEKEFSLRWDTELRAELSLLSASQASLWGRLLLQAFGSSPAAWRAALEKFPNAPAARAWRDQSALETSWRRKCELVAPLARAEGGVVVFTQFLQTQAALAAFLSQSGIEAFVINGSTPAAERQPVTELFRKRGGALLLTHSGTEGRNLQFSHHLVNFDLPWNPMEIEQRIGRLHRLGQKHPVRIHNFVQAGTLQEHLLEILQEKLNLFELVVGETGLVLGERFGSDEFAEEVFRIWRESEGRVGEALSGLGDELAAARDAYGEVKQLDETLFAKDFELL
jgi:superfamily II DNA or RNA helicase